MSGRQRNIRTKRATSEEDDVAQAEAGPSGAQQAPATQECLRDKLEETKLLQKMRKKSSGMQAEKLAASTSGGTQAQLEEEPGQGTDHHVARLMDSYVKETAVRETAHDEQMDKFVEMELAKRLGKRMAGEELDEGEQRRRKIEADLYSIPAHLQTVQQDVPLAGLMTGITEVVLPLEERLRKIEETEEVKRRMLAAASRRAHIPVEEDRRASGGEGKMKRSACPVVFGRPEARRCDQDKDEREAQRRRVVTETRPVNMGKPKGGGGRGR